MQVALETRAIGKVVDSRADHMIVLPVGDQPVAFVVENLLRVAVVGLSNGVANVALGERLAVLEDERASAVHVTVDELAFVSIAILVIEDARAGECVSRHRADILVAVVEVHGAVAVSEAVQHVALVSLAALLVDE